jgi:hypothetical protein
VQEFAGFVADALDVSFGCVCEGAVPMDGRQVVSGAGAVGQLKKSLLGGCLGVGGRRCECESKQEASYVRSVLHVFGWNRGLRGKLAECVLFQVWIGW